MFHGKKILALIPARGGSKGIKDKNITDLGGKPLIAYSVECGLHSKYVDSVVVTTDSAKIAEVAKQCGARVPFLRPAELASDTAKTLDAVLHAVKTLEGMGESYDLLLLLQPTQPLRTSEDVDGAIEAYFALGGEDLVSVCEVSDHPILIRTIEQGRLQNLLSCSSTCRRQDMPAYYRINGCIYINATNGACPFGNVLCKRNLGFYPFGIPFRYRCRSDRQRA
jgi:CMP-N-acetylneuraminic acid synthetase